MPYPVKEDVQGVLKPYRSRIRSVVVRAWAEWRAIAVFRSDMELAALMYSRTVANYVFDAIARIAIADLLLILLCIFKSSRKPSNSSLRMRCLPFSKRGMTASFAKISRRNQRSRSPTPTGCLPGLPPETAKVIYLACRMTSTRALNMFWWLRAIMTVCCRNMRSTPPALAQARPMRSFRSRFRPRHRTTTISLSPKFLILKNQKKTSKGWQRWGTCCALRGRTRTHSESRRYTTRHAANDLSRIRK